jgi:parvulin-like peptidyl-prolyl isomerase
MCQGTGNNKVGVPQDPSGNAGPSSVKHGNSHAVSGVRRAGRYAILAACLWMVVLVGAGCDGKGRKAALTEEEIRRYTDAQKPQRPDELIVSGETVTFDDLTAASFDASAQTMPPKEKLMELARQTTLEQFMQVARPQVLQKLNSRIGDVVLYKQAKRALGDRADEQLDKRAEKEMREFIMEHGGNGAAADAALQKMGMNRARFKEYKKREIVSRYYVLSRFPYNRPITHRELLEYYEKMRQDSFLQAGMVQFRLIDIQIAKVALPEGSDDPLQAARTLAKDLTAKIKAGEDFGELAKKYSHDYRSAQGGLWQPRDPDALAEPYDVLAKEAQKMKVGDVAGPIEALDHIFIMKLEQKQEKGYRPLTEVQDRVEERIMLDRRRAALKQLDTEISQQAAVGNTDRFLDYCLERIYRQAHTPASVP